MSDAEWLKNTKSGKPHIPDLPPKATKPSRATLITIAAAVLAGLYFYHDTQTRQAERTAAQQAAKRADAAPRAPSAAEIRDNDAKNRAYAKKLEDDYYRTEISRGILQLNDIASRFNDINQVASATARIALPQLIQQMQAMRREAAAITPHQCLRPAATSLTAGISSVINGYLSFMQSGSAADNNQTKQHLESAQAALGQYIKQRDACVNW